MHAMDRNVLDLNDDVFDIQMALCMLRRDCNNGDTTASNMDIARYFITHPTDICLTCKVLNRVQDRLETGLQSGRFVKLSKTAAEPHRRWGVSAAFVLEMRVLRKFCGLVETIVSPSDQQYDWPTDKAEVPSQKQALASNAQITKTSCAIKASWEDFDENLISSPRCLTVSPHDSVIDTTTFITGVDSESSDDELDRAGGTKLRRSTSQQSVESVSSSASTDSWDMIIRNVNVKRSSSTESFGSQALSGTDSALSTTEEERSGESDNDGNCSDSESCNNTMKLYAVDARHADLLKAIRWTSFEDLLKVLRIHAEDEGYDSAAGPGICFLEPFDIIQKAFSIAVSVTDENSNEILENTANSAGTSPISSFSSLAKHHPSPHGELLFTAFPPGLENNEHKRKTYELGSFNHFNTESRSKHFDPEDDGHSGDALSGSPSSSALAQAGSFCETGSTNLLEKSLIHIDHSPFTINAAEPQRNFPVLQTPEKEELVVNDDYNVTSDRISEICADADSPRLTSSHPPPVHASDSISEKINSEPMLTVPDKSLASSSPPSSSSLDASLSLSKQCFGISIHTEDCNSPSKRNASISAHQMNLQVSSYGNRVDIPSPIDLEPPLCDCCVSIISKDSFNDISDSDSNTASNPWPFTDIFISPRSQAVIEESAEASRWLEEHSVDSSSYSPCMVPPYRNRQCCGSPPMKSLLSPSSEMEDQLLKPYGYRTIGCAPQQVSSQTTRMLLSSSTPAILARRDSDEDLLLSSSTELIDSELSFGFTGRF